jgi:hypothetical protein
MQINHNAAASPPGSFESPGASGASNGSSFQDLLSQLNAYGGSNPGQGMFNSILAQLGVTPQQYAAMTPQEREKIEEKVQQLMKKEMQAQIQQQNQSLQLSQMQQPGTQTGTQSDKSSSSNKGNMINIML